MNLLYAIPALAIATGAGAQQADVTFFVIGKHANFQQDAAGDRKSVDYSFFSEVFMSSKGSASNGALVFPTGERIEFADKRKLKAAIL